jgi:hypothetical protein
MRSLLDLSASHAFENDTGEPQVSLNIANLASEAQRQTFQYDSATFTYYDPCMVIALVGSRLV